MVAGTSQLSLCQRSLAQIGGKALISSVFPSDGSRAGDMCNLLYVPTYTQLGRCAWWGYFQKQNKLNLLGAAPGTPEGGSNGVGILPPQPWLYLYQIPVDSLKCRAIVPFFPAQNDGVPLTTINNAAPICIRGMGQIPFKIRYSTDADGNPLQTLVTNQSQAQLIYTVNQPNPVIWDSQFEAAFVAALAAFLVPALAMNLPLMQLQIGVAERIIAEARASDGNEGSTSQDHLPDWIRARSGGAQGWYGGNDGWNAGMGYENMAWPSGG